MANNFANDPDVVALYRFESGALTTDSSSNGNTLTNVNTVEEDTTNEKEGACCADFTKANKEVLYCTDANLSSNFPLKSGTNNKKFTISAWIRLKSEVPAGAFYTIFSKHGSGVSSFWMALNGSEKLRFALGYDNGDSVELSSTHATALSTDTWYHVTVSYDDSDKSYAIRVRDADGSVVGTDLTGNTTNNINVEDGRMSIGATYGTSWLQLFDGLIDELVVFKRVLSATEITAIAKGQYAPFKTYEESVSDLFKASDSQDSIRKLEFANSDSFKLSEEIVAIGKFPKSISDLFKVYEGVHRIIGVVDPTKMKLSAIEGRSFIDFSEAGSLTPHIGKRITILDWNGKKLVGFIKQAGTGETYSTIYQSDFSSDADGFYPINCLLQGNADGVGGEDNWLKFTIDDSLNYHYAQSKGGLTPKLAYYKITYKYYIPSSNSICNDIEFWFGNGQNDRNLPTTLDAVTQRVETFVPVRGETIYFALGNVNNGYYVQDSGGDDVFYVKDIVLEQLLTPSETGVTVDWAYQEEGFNYNEVNEYSYEIGGGGVGYGFPNEVVDLVTFSELSSIARGAIENISDLFKLSESLSPYQQEVMKDSPAVYYRLGELEGSIAYDSSGNGKHLGYPESGVTKGANGLVAGNNKAALFDGSSRAYETNYDPGEKTAITLEAWCKASVLNASHNIVFAIGTTGHYISLVNYGENSIYTLFSIRVSEIQKLLYCYNKVMSVDEVYHIVATWESGDYQRVYLNGVELGRSASIVSGTLTHSPGVELAAAPDGHFFNGTLDEVAVYETALSPERVAAHYRAGKIGEAPVINFIESVSDKALFVDSSTGNLIIALSVSDAAKFIDSSIMSQGVYIYNVSDFFTLKDSSSVAGKLIVAVSEEFKLSDFTDGKKKTQFSISDIFELSDLGVTKKLSREEVSDFLRVIDNGESVKRAILEVSDKFKMSDYSIFMTLDDLGLVAIKLVYRGKNFLTLKERKDFTFKNRTSFFTTKKE